jgi:phosphate transport system permease protein
MSRFVATPLVKSKLRYQTIASSIAFAMLLCMLLPLFAILGDLLWQAAPSLTWDFLTTAPTRGMREGGVWPAVIGTLYLVTISLALAAPVGVLAAVYLTEYAKENWFNHIVNIAVLNLAGVPSIVHALFGLGAFVYGAQLGFSILSASLTLAIMTMPVIIASTRQALLSVPRSYREACWNLGASRWQTIRTIVLPNAMSGILTGVILQVSRAAGETAPIMFTGAVFYKAIQPGTLFPYALDEECMALSMHLYTLSTQTPGVDASVPNATAVLLLGLVFFVNASAIGLRAALRLRGKA